MVQRLREQIRELLLEPMGRILWSTVKELKALKLALASPQSLLQNFADGLDQTNVSLFEIDPAQLLQQEITNAFGITSGPFLQDREIVTLDQIRRWGSEPWWVDIHETEDRAGIVYKPHRT
jgi:hypothetical protein